MVVVSSSDGVDGGFGFERKEFATRQRLDIGVVFGAAVKRLNVAVLSVRAICRKRKILNGGPGNGSIKLS